MKGRIMLSSAQKIKMALAYKGIKEAELARLLETTPQNFNQAMKRDNFSQSNLEKIAGVLDAKYVSYFEFSDGTKI